MLIEIKCTDLGFNNSTKSVFSTLSFKLSCSIPRIIINTILTNQPGHKLCNYSTVRKWEEVITNKTHPILHFQNWPDNYKSCEVTLSKYRIGYSVSTRLHLANKSNDFFLCPYPEHLFLLPMTFMYVCQITKSGAHNHMKTNFLGKKGEIKRNDGGGEVVTAIVVVAIWDMCVCVSILFTLHTDC